MIKIVASLTSIFTFLLATISFYAFDAETSWSALFGGGLMIINLLGLWFLWRQIFFKKSIALVVLIIIFKYLILGLILWNLNQIEWMRPKGLILGLSALIFGIVGSTIYKKFSTSSN